MPGTPGDLFAAFKTSWDASTEIPDLNVNGPYRDEKPTGIALPYVVVSLIANPLRTRTNTSTYWGSVIQVAIYAGSATAVDALMDVIGDEIDGFQLALGSGKGAVIDLTRIGETVTKDDKKIDQGILQYRMHRQKVRTDRQ